MRHRVAGKKLGRTTAHKIAMFRNMVTSLILNDRIETTLPKAKELRRLADKMVTIAKKNSIAARRNAMKILKDRSALQKLFSTLADRYKDRNGGYTRIMKLGFRHGDDAAMAIIEYVSAEVKKAVQPKKQDKKAKKAAAKKVPEKKAPAKKAPKAAAKKEAAQKSKVDANKKATGKTKKTFTKPSNKSS